MHFYCRFSPLLKVLNYSAGKDVREEQRAKVMSNVAVQGGKWDRAKFPFHIMLAHYEVGLIPIPLRFLDCILLREGGNQRLSVFAKVSMAMSHSG